MVLKRAEWEEVCGGGWAGKGGLDQRRAGEDRKASPADWGGLDSFLRAMRKALSMFSRDWCGPDLY